MALFHQQKNTQGILCVFPGGFVACVCSLAGKFYHLKELRPLQLDSFAFILVPVMILILSALCNRIYVISDIYNRYTLWPGHTFLLFCVAVGLDASWTNVVVHGLAGILIINELLNIQYNRDARLSVFNIAFCIGIASFFDSTVVLIAPLMALGLRHLKPLNIKEYIIYFLGLSSPYYFLWAYSFLTGDYAQWELIFPVSSWFSFPGKKDYVALVRWIPPLVGMLAGLVYFIASYNSLPVRIRRVSLSVLYLIAGAIVAAVAGGGQQSVIFYVAPAFSFLATLLMLRYSNKYHLELVHIIFVGIIIASVLVSNL